MNKDLHKYSDAELLSFYRRTRKPDYLIGLYERYMPLVYGVALKYLKNVPDAQDAVMQIWEELFEKVLHHDIQVFKAWLYSCVRNYCLMELRRRSGNNFVGWFGSSKFPNAIEYIRDTDPQEKALQECMEALPEKQRLCIRYFFMDELSYKEIGQTSGFTLKMVKSFIQNGKRNLQLCLERKGIKANE